MSYNPEPVPPGSVTTAMLGGDVTEAARALLQQDTPRMQRKELGLDESATNSTGLSL